MDWAVGTGFFDSFISGSEARIPLVFFRPRKHISRFVTGGEGPREREKSVYDYQKVVSID
jgi:hypothetical protein